MTLFITGSEGFIGRALTKRCDEQDIDYIPYDLALGGDICDPSIADIIPKGATIVHLAALSTNKACAENETLAIRVNVGGTENLLRAANKCNVKQFIFASSEWVYDGLDGPCHEDRSLAIPAMASVYAQTKALAEQKVMAFSNSTVLRFGIVYGPRAEPGSAVESIFVSVRDKNTVRVGHMKTARRFIHVEDVVSGILHAVGVNGVFNLTGDELASLRDVSLAACEVLWGASGVIGTEQDLTQSLSIRDAPNDKAKRELGWKPEYDLARGLRTLMEREPGAIYVGDPIVEVFESFGIKGP